MPEPVGVLVFAKAPIPGAVKTRLAPCLGAEEAARLYRRVAQQCIETAIAAGMGPVEIYCTPDPTHPWFASLAARFGLRLAPQRGRDLGERMHTALAEAFQRHRHAVLIGTLSLLVDGSMGFWPLPLVGSRWIGLGAAIVLALAGVEELLQALSPHRSSSPSDFLADVAGAVVLCTIARVLHSHAARRG